MPTETHLALQQHYAGQDGVVEAELAGYRADVLRDGVIYEIQTGSFPDIRDKLAKLSRRRQVVLVFPLRQTKIIVRVDPGTGEELSARRSPKRGALAEVFDELVYMPKLLRRKHLALEVVMTVERELRCDDGQGSWRRKGVSIVGRELLAIVGRHRFDAPTDFLRLLPEGLPERFTVHDLRDRGGLSRRLASRMAYALRELGTIRHIGKEGNAYVYRRAAPKGRTSR